MHTSIKMQVGTTVVSAIYTIERGRTFVYRYCYDTTYEGLYAIVNSLNSDVMEYTRNLAANYYEVDKLEDISRFQLAPTKFDGAFYLVTNV